MFYSFRWPTRIFNETKTSDFFPDKGVWVGLGLEVGAYRVRVYSSVLGSF